jgi:hypothetical protein
MFQRIGNALIAASQNPILKWYKFKAHFFLIYRHAIS